jgi:hypothetical protein
VLGKHIGDQMVTVGGGLVVATAGGPPVTTAGITVIVPGAQIAMGTVVSIAVRAGTLSSTLFMAANDMAAEEAKEVGAPASGSRPGINAGEYRFVGGHHIHAKAAFRGHLTYDPRRGFSISQEYMRSRGWDHQAMTSKQRELFGELARSGRTSCMAEHSRIAQEALVAGGATQAEAQALVQESLHDLAQQGVTAPTRIPWQE